MQYWSFVTLSETPGLEVAILNIIPASFLKTFLQSNVSYAARVRHVAVSDKMLGEMTM